MDKTYCIMEPQVKQYVAAIILADESLQGSTWFVNYNSDASKPVVWTDRPIECSELNARATPFWLGQGMSSGFHGCNILHGLEWADKRGCIIHWSI